jgi:hypothetical protein
LEGVKAVGFLEVVVSIYFGESLIDRSKEVKAGIGRGSKPGKWEKEGLRDLELSSLEGSKLDTGSNGLL